MLEKPGVRCFTILMAKPRRIRCRNVPRSLMWVSPPQYPPVSHRAAVQRKHVSETADLWCVRRLLRIATRGQVICIRLHLFTWSRGGFIVDLPVANTGNEVPSTRGRCEGYSKGCKVERVIDAGNLVAGLRCQKENYLSAWDFWRLNSFLPENLAFKR